YPFWFYLVCSASFFFSSRRRHTRFSRDWSSDVCSSDLHVAQPEGREGDEGDQRRQRDDGEPAVHSLSPPPGVRFPVASARPTSRSEERRVGKECRSGS